MRTDIYCRDLEKYVKERENMLKDFRIRLNKTEREHLHSLTSEIAVDNFIKEIIRKKL